MSSASPLVSAALVAVDAAEEGDSPPRGFSASESASAEVPFDLVAAGAHAELLVEPAHAGSARSPAPPSLLGAVPHLSRASPGRFAAEEPSPAWDAHARAAAAGGALHGAALQAEAGGAARERVWAAHADEGVFSAGLAPSDPPTTLEVTRDARGAAMGYAEVAVPEAGQGAGSSSSLLRAPGRKADAVRGSVNHVPFRPGGLTGPGPAMRPRVYDDLVAEAAEAADAAAVPGTARALGDIVAEEARRLAAEAAAVGGAVGVSCPVAEVGRVAMAPGARPAGGPAARAARLSASGASERGAQAGAAASPALVAHSVEDGGGGSGGGDDGAQDESGAYIAHRDHRTGGEGHVPVAVRFEDIFADEIMLLDDEDAEEQGAGEEEEGEGAGQGDDKEEKEEEEEEEEKKMGHEEAGPGGGGSGEGRGIDSVLRGSVPPGGGEQAGGDAWSHQAAAASGSAGGGHQTFAVMERRPVDDFHELLPNPAIRYPFELDVFQKEAVLHLERGESVFVAAHTSAGKTVVAEYAVALAMKHLTRAVYTSPIKTLSNQKFREFRRTFGEENVGVVTGDVSVNPEAPCIILTTEILRSMLYKGADIVRDVEYVIFDEVHYVNDAERGVVWEEVIIMLPPHVKLIMLSATVPNTFEFADWVGRTKQQQIFVISTEKRPVPLQHYLWCHGRLYNVVDQHGNFKMEGFKRARLGPAAAGASAGGGKGPGSGGGKQGAASARRRGGGVQKGGKSWAMSGAMRSGGGGGGGGGSNRGGRGAGQWSVLVNFLRRKELLPVAVFSFSRKQCEENAGGLTNMDLCSSQEKSEVHLFAEAALARLHGSDRTLPQVLRVRDMAGRGIGVHHAGMLPILKEMVEMLFARGLIKVLFATETFAMGVNTPTKTVVFSGTRKFDGKDFRDLLPGEYTQMSGRAGRRGLDTFGVVVVACRHDEVPAELSVKTMIMGRPARLSSQFRLTYNMILNLLRQEDMRVEEMIKRSFSEFSAQKDAPQQLDQLRRDRRRLGGMAAIDCIYGEPTIEEYHAAAAHMRQLSHDVMSRIMRSPQLTSKFLAPGRVVVAGKYGLSHCLGVVLRVSASAASQLSGSYRAERSAQFVALLLVPGEWSPPRRVRDRAAARGSVTRHGAAGGASYLVDELRPGDVETICRSRVDANATKIIVDRHGPTISAAVQALRALAAAGWDRLEHVDAMAEMRAADLDLADAYELRQRLGEATATNKCHDCPKREEHYAEMQRQSILRHRIGEVRRALSDNNMRLVGDFQRMQTVLQRLQYVDDQRAVLLKGRAACEINTCESLIVTELVFDNVLTDLAPEEAVALLSCLIFQDRSADPPQLTDRLQGAFDRLVGTAQRLGSLQLECGVDVAPEDFVSDNINGNLVEVVYEWAKGTPFARICDLTNVLEGSIVRCITRLDETCRDVRNAARVIGDAQLYQKMEKASEMIKRDIVGISSLYVA